MNFYVHKTSLLIYSLVFVSAQFYKLTLKFIYRRIQVAHKRRDEYSNKQKQSKTCILIG